MTADELWRAVESWQRVSGSLEQSIRRVWGASLRHSGFHRVLIPYSIKLLAGGSVVPICWRVVVGIIASIRLERNDSFLLQDS